MHIIAAMVLSVGPMPVDLPSPLDPTPPQPHPIEDWLEPTEEEPVHPHPIHEL